MCTESAVLCMKMWDMHSAKGCMTPRQKWLLPHLANSTTVGAFIAVQTSGANDYQPFDSKISGKLYYKEFINLGLCFHTTQKLCIQVLTPTPPLGPFFKGKMGRFCHFGWDKLSKSWILKMPMKTYPSMQIDTWEKRSVQAGRLHNDTELVKRKSPMTRCYDRLSKYSTTRACGYILVHFCPAPDLQRGPRKLFTPNPLIWLRVLQL